ncbi:MAG: hypothetical protein HDT23_07815 [Ruminococcus sp.]|nr:hypothetical protein [Ruminococcus sp.]
MKILEVIGDFLCFIFRIVGILILILVILFMSISAKNTIIYKKYDETGIMKNGNLCISHMASSPGFGDKYYNSDDSVLQEVEDFHVYEGVKLGIGNADGDVFGKVYEPINSGKSDIYVGYSIWGGEPMNYFEVYHVEVDEKLNITYNMENIDKETFENVFTGD